jgi:hypothetical protein
MGAPLVGHGAASQADRGRQGWNDVSAMSNSANEPRARASEMLRTVLTEAEYRQVISQGYLDVPSTLYPWRVYRIPHGPGAVRVYEGGSLVMQLCVQPEEALPDDDLILMHKLLLEGSEAEYLATANQLPVLHGTADPEPAPPHGERLTADDAKARLMAADAEPDAGFVSSAPRLA